MKDLKKSYKKEFEKICPSEEQKQKMLNNITKHSNYNVHMHFAILICSVVIFCIFGITNAYDIGKSFNSLIVNYKEKKDEDGNKYSELVTTYDGVLEVDYDANIVARENWVESFEKGLKTFYSNYDLEQILGVKFLRNKYMEPGYEVNTLRKNEDEKIAYMELYEVYEKFNDNYEYVEDKKLLESVELTAQFKTKYYKENNDFDLKVRNYYSVKNYYIKNLDTTALLVRLNERGNHYLVIFAHNNIRYSFYYDNYNLSMDENNTLDRIHEILDSFYY